MAAEGLQQVCAFVKRIEQVQSRNAAAGAARQPVDSHREKDGGTVESFHQLGCHDADDAGMPVRAADDDDEILIGVAVFFHPFRSVFPDVRVDGAALIIGIAEFARILLCRSAVFGEEQFDRRGGDRRAFRPR